METKKIDFKCPDNNIINPKKFFSYEKRNQYRTCYHYLAIIAKKHDLNKQKLVVPKYEKNTLKEGSLIRFPDRTFYLDPVFKSKLKFLINPPDTISDNERYIVIENYLFLINI